MYVCTKIFHLTLCKAVRILCKLIKIYFGIIEATTANGATAFEIGPRLVIQGEHWYFPGPVKLVFMFPEIIWILLVNFTQATVQHIVACVSHPTLFFIATFCNKRSRFYPSNISHTVGKNATFRIGWRRHFFQCTATVKKTRLRFSLFLR